MQDAENCSTIKPTGDSLATSAIFEQSPIGIVLYDSGGRITAINPSALAIFGIAREEDIRNIPLFQEPNLPAGLAERLLAGESVRLTAPYDFDSVE